MCSSAWTSAGHRGRSRRRSRASLRLATPTPPVQGGPERDAPDGRKPDPLAAMVHGCRRRCFGVGSPQEAAPARGQPVPARRRNTPSPARRAGPRARHRRGKAGRAGLRPGSIPRRAALWPSRERQDRSGERNRAEEPRTGATGRAPDTPRHLRHIRTNSERAFRRLRIGRLDPKSTRRALGEPAREAGRPYGADALPLVARRSRDYPFFVQLLGREAWAAAERAGRPGIPLASRAKRSSARGRMSRFSTWSASRSPVATVWKRCCQHWRSRCDDREASCPMRGSGR